MDLFFSAVIWPVLFLAVAALLIEFVRRPLTIHLSEQYDKDDSPKHRDFSTRLIIQGVIILAMAIVSMVISAIFMQPDQSVFRMWTAVILFGGYGLYLTGVFIRAIRFRAKMQKVGATGV